MIASHTRFQELQEREKSIHQLESDIVDMNTIFKDLATMVHEQGEMVDSIEVHVSEAQVRVGEGTQQLRQAEEYMVVLCGQTTIRRPFMVHAIKDLSLNPNFI